MGRGCEWKPARARASTGPGVGAARQWWGAGAPFGPVNRSSISRVREGVSSLSQSGHLDLFLVRFTNLPKISYREKGSPQIC